MKGIIKLNSAIVSAASVVGKAEYEGPIGSFFDIHDNTDRFGQKTWEKAESEMQRLAFSEALSKSGYGANDIDALFAGDLLNQCVGSTFGLLEYPIPYFGLYGACSTAVEGLMLSAIMTSNGVFDLCGAVTSSHNCTAERQYRNPIEYGGQKPPSAQWTATASGAFVVGREGNVRITEALPGRVIEKGITDAFNMGAAMAPAALDTLLRYFEESECGLDEFDVIVTGDLGYEGGSILCELMKAEGYDIEGIYNDCGMIIYNKSTQDTHSGGSGCGCSASVLASYFVPKIAKGDIKNMLILGTGAMMSPSSIQQGEAIPAICHLLRLESKV